MKKIWFVVSLGMLIISLAGNGVLFADHTKQNTKIANLQEANSDISKKLSNTQSALTQKASDLEKSNAALLSATNKLKTSTDLNKILVSTMQEVASKWLAVNCTSTIKKDTIGKVASNAALIDPITSAVEIEYGFSSVNTTFKTVWNNSKTAIFTVLDPENATVQAVATWNSKISRVDTIYDVGSGCLYYIYQ